MYKIIVFTHGSLAESLVRTSRLILGNQPDIETYCVEPGCNLEEMRNGVEQSIRRSNDSGQEVLVLTDLMYGTPFNTMIQLEEECSFTHITGTNLPFADRGHQPPSAGRKQQKFCRTGGHGQGRDCRQPRSAADELTSTG